MMSRAASRQARKRSGTKAKILAKCLGFRGLGVLGASGASCDGAFRRCRGSRTDTVQIIAVALGAQNQNGSLSFTTASGVLNRRRLT